MEYRKCMVRWDNWIYDVRITCPFLLVLFLLTFLWPLLYTIFCLVCMLLQTPVLEVPYSHILFGFTTISNCSCLSWYIREQTWSGSMAWFMLGSFLSSSWTFRFVSTSEFSLIIIYLVILLLDSSLVCKFLICKGRVKTFVFLFIWGFSFNILVSIKIFLCWQVYWLTKIFFWDDIFHCTEARKVFMLLLWSKCILFFRIKDIYSIILYNKTSKRCNLYTKVFTYQANFF